MTPDAIARYDQRVPRYTSYPTAPHFSGEVGPDTYEGWLRDVPQDEPLSLYLHVPFCAELCLYCGCHTTVAHRYGPIASYVDLLLREIALVARHLGTPRPVVHIHWGGGTPTILSPDDLRRVMEALRTQFAVRDDAEIAIEIDPRTVTLEHVQALQQVGLTRASLGVQDFDPRVQRTIKRIQSFEQTQQVATWLREAGVRGLNLDLMYGLPHQTVESVSASVEQALRLMPDRIALFGYAHVPWMKRHQALLPESALPGPAERVRQMQAAAHILQTAGYVAVGLDHFARPDDPLAQRQADRSLHRNFQGYTTDDAATLIGFGTSSIGALRQGYVQNAATTVAYREAITSGRLATIRGVAVNDDDRLRRAIIERLMCDLAVDLDDVSAPYGRSAADFVPEQAALEGLRRDGLVTREGTRFVVREEARALVRNVCAVFDRYLERGEQRYSRAV